MTKLPKLHGVTSRYCCSICKEKGDKDGKEEKEDSTRLMKKVRRLEADLGYSNLTVNVTPHSSYQRTHQSWHADNDDDQILIKYRKQHLPGILPPGGFRAPASSREADISSSGILPAEPLQLRWKPVPWTRSTYSPRQHPDVSSGSILANNYDSSIGVDATPPSGSEDGKVRPTKESTAKDIRTKGDDGVGSDLESDQKSSGGLGSEAEIRRVDGGGVTTYESSTGRRVLVLTKSHSRHRPGCCRPLLSPTNPLRTSIGVISLMTHAQGSKNERNRLRPVPKVMIVGSGTFNPVHKLHIRRFNLARDFLEDHKGMRVVGGIISPSHATLVRQRHRVRAAEIIPPKHRLFMARAAIGEGSWLVVDPWELTRRRAMDYLSVLEHVKEVYHDTFPGSADDITILYMCPASQLHCLNPAMLRDGGFGIITICRPLEKERLLKELSPRFQNLVMIVEDSTILTAKHEKISSAMVRKLLKEGKPVEGLVGKAVARYMKDNYIAEGVSGKHKWTREDNVFMFEGEDKRDRPYHNLPRLYMRPASQIPLQY